MSYKFSRTFDLDYVTECLTNPLVWHMSTDDMFKNVDRELYFVPDTLPFYYLKVDGYGLLIGEPKDLNVYEVHVALNEESRGLAVYICREAIRWFFDNEDCNKITAAIPSFNHHAMRIAKYVGFSSAGTREKAFIKNGKAYNLNLFELNKE